MTTTTPDKFTDWINESRPGDVVQIKTRFTWLKKVIVAVDEVWIHFHDAKIKKSSLKPETFRPVMQPTHPVVKEFLRLPHEQQLVMRDALKLAGLATFAGNGETIDEAFLRILKADKAANYKALQVATNLVNSSAVELAMDMTIEARDKYLKDKAMIDAIESEIARYFKPRGWIFEEINGSPFWKKSVHRDGVIHCQFVLHGIEAATNDYIYVKADYDKITDKEIIEETHRFKEFKQLTQFINLAERIKTVLY